MSRDDIKKAGMLFSSWKTNFLISCMKSFSIKGIWRKYGIVPAEKW